MKYDSKVKKSFFISSSKQILSCGKIKLIFFKNKIFF